jgi:hypothetical protein
VRAKPRMLTADSRARWPPSASAHSLITAGQVHTERLMLCLAKDCKTAADKLQPVQRVLARRGQLTDP